MCIELSVTMVTGKQTGGTSYAMIVAEGGIP